MDSLNALISNARNQGQTDDQIIQALSASGWNIEQVKVALKSHSLLSVPNYGEPKSEQTLSDNKPYGSAPPPFPIQSTLNPDLDIGYRNNNPLKRKSKLQLVIIVLAALVVLVAISIRHARAQNKLSNRYSRFYRCYGE